MAEEFGLNKLSCPLGRKSYHHGNLRETLIKSALDILKEGSLSDLSLRALARKAGVSQTAPYRHFEDKEALIVELKTEGMRMLGDGMWDMIETEKDPLVRLQKIGLKYIKFAEDYPAHFKVMFEYELSDYNKYCDLRAESDNTFKCLQNTVDDCLALPNARKVDPMVAQFGLWAENHIIMVIFGRP